MLPAGPERDSIEKPNPGLFNHENGFVLLSAGADSMVQRIILDNGILSSYSGMMP